MMVQAGSVLRKKYSLTGWRWRSPSAIWCGADQVEEPWGPVALKMYALTSDFIREKELLDMPYSSEHWPSKFSHSFIHHTSCPWDPSRGSTDNIYKNVGRSLGPVEGWRKTYAQHNMQYNATQCNSNSVHVILLCAGLCCMRCLVDAMLACAWVPSCQALHIFLICHCLDIGMYGLAHGLQ